MELRDIVLTFIIQLPLGLIALVSLLKLMRYMGLLVGQGDDPRQRHAIIAGIVSNFSRLLLFVVLFGLSFLFRG